MPRYDPYAIEMDCGKNYHSYGGFEHFARNYGIIKKVEI